MRKGLFITVIILALLGCLATIAMFWHRDDYPYGQSHCCILGMSSALVEFAENNGGRFPTGQASAEASLSLLYKSNCVDADTLRGMTVTEKTVRATLDSGGLLGPDTCGWQYVPGLTKADDPSLAILWCKQPLNHFGQRTRDGGRQVVFLDRGTRWISGAKWPGFLGEQKKLLEQRSARALAAAPLVRGSIQLPDGNRADEVDGDYSISEISQGPDNSGSGTSSGNGLGSNELLWYQAPIENGYVTRTLTYSNLVSDPVTITFTNGIPDVTNFVFKMNPRP